jgi:transcriptional regulator NrdR family protein
MECPHCGALSRGLQKVVSTRISCGIGVTRVRKCLSCEERFYSVELPVERHHITCAKHYHIKESIFRRLITSLYQ